MGSWIHDGVERICDGALVKYGENTGDSFPVQETPSEVRTQMLREENDLLVLHHYGSGVEGYVKPGDIIAVTPLWKKLEVSS